MSENTINSIATIIGNLSEVSSNIVEWIKENPQEITKAFWAAEPTLERFMEIERSNKVKLIKLHPDWDFAILQSEDYPEVGIAVSNHDGKCGCGFRLLLKAGGGFEQNFTAPCGCCDWYSQLKTVCSDEDVAEFGSKLVSCACKKEGIDFLLLHGWGDNPYRNKKVISMWASFVDPYRKNELEKINTEKLSQAFQELVSVREVNPERVISLIEFFENTKKRGEEE
ncbi:MAG: hypothetical protein WCO05_03400 [Candidatus Moraniibacteriota bacterium]